MEKSVSEIIERFTNEEGTFNWGIHSVMKSLRGNCLFEVVAQSGKFKLISWPDNQWDDERKCYVEPPTQEEIDQEFIRHKTIYECVQHFKNK